MSDDTGRYLQAMGQAVMGLGSDVIFLVDRASLRLIEANRAFLETLGYQRAEVAAGDGARHPHRRHPLGRADAQAALVRAPRPGAAVPGRRAHAGRRGLRGASPQHRSAHQRRHAAPGAERAGAGRPRRAAERGAQPRAHGGNVTVYSEPGKGSAFRLFLPLANDGQGVRPPSLERLVALTPKHVLVIDDEALVREQFARALRGLGHTVDLAESGAQGLVRYQGSKRRYDVVVLDVVMPGLSGLRRLDPGVRAVVTSGFALDGDIQAILDEGARVFLPKPFLRDSLSKALAEACASEESAKK